MGKEMNIDFFCWKTFLTCFFVFIFLLVDGVRSCKEEIRWGWF